MRMGILELPATCSWPGKLSSPPSQGSSERQRGAVSGKHAPGDAVYFGDFAQLEDGVGDAAEGGTQVGSEDERARGPAIGLASVARERHGGLRIQIERLRGTWGSISGLWPWRGAAGSGSSLGRRARRAWRSSRGSSRSA